MIEIKRVLFLTDFSDEAAEALQYAREFADKFSARLYLLHVIEDATHKRYGTVVGDYHAFDKNAQEKTAAWLAQIVLARLALALRDQGFDPFPEFIGDFPCGHCTFLCLSCHS